MKQNVAGRDVLCNTFGTQLFGYTTTIKIKLNVRYHKSATTRIHNNRSLVIGCHVFVCVVVHTVTLFQFTAEGWVSDVWHSTPLPVMALCSLVCFCFAVVLRVACCQQLKGMDKSLSNNLTKFVPKRVVLDPPVLEAAANGTVVQLVKSQLDAPAFFASGAGRVLTGLESYGLASIKYQHQGRRTVLMTDREALATTMLARMGATAFDVNQLANYFLGMTAVEFNKYIEEHKVYTAVLSPGEVLFTPCSMVVAEKVDKSPDSLGVKISCVPLVKPKEEAEKFMKMISSGKPGSGPAKLWTFLTTILNKE